MVRASCRRIVWRPEIGKSQLLRLLLVGMSVPIAVFGPIPVSAQSTLEAGHTPRRFFLSGHSLTDNPYGNYIKAIGDSQGAPLGWNQQIVIGSPVRARTRGNHYKDGVWDGYAAGKDRDGRPVNVLAEFARRADPLYDTLIVTEAHGTVAQLLWNDTVRFLRHFHERLIEHNSAARTFVVEPWETIKDLSNPTPWVENERNATVAWSCVVTRINTSLAHEGRKDRLSTIPTAPALAALVDAIASDRAPAVLREGGTRAALARLLPDGVHLSNRGFFFAAALTYMQMTGRQLTKPWYPSNAFSASEALALQEFAWNFLEDRKRNFSPLGLPACRRHIATRYCGTWNLYVPDQWQTKQDHCSDAFMREDASTNPLVFDAQRDKAYWYGPP